MFCEENFPELKVTAIYSSRFETFVCSRNWCVLQEVGSLFLLQ